MKVNGNPNNTVLPGPAELLKPEWIRIMREQAFACESAAKLTDPVTSLILEQGWLRMLMPEACGGLAWPLPRVAAFLEALAWADGNTGWCVNLGAGANMFAGYLDSAAAKAIFSPAGTWCAGSGAVTGHARQVPGGYRVSGYWKYASGSAHATHFTANCFVQDETGQAIEEGGVPVFRSVIVPARDVTVHDSWQATGLKATSSDDFEMDDVFVPAAHIFSLNHPVTFAPLYRFPFEVMAVVNMACMTTGIGWHFIDLFEALMSRKRSQQGGLPAGYPGVVRKFEAATRRFTRARGRMYAELRAVWKACEEGGSPEAAAGPALITAAREAAAEARNLLHACFQSCGMDILLTGSELNKTWRDMAAAAQHHLLGPYYGQPGGPG